MAAEEALTLYTSRIKTPISREGRALLVKAKSYVIISTNPIKVMKTYGFGFFAFFLQVLISHQTLCHQIQSFVPNRILIAICQ